MEVGSIVFSDNYAELYDQIHSEKDYKNEMSRLTKILIELKISKCNEILDFGCGTGKHIKELHEIGFNISGYDININMIEKAKENNPNLNLYEHLSLVPKKFNFTYSLFDVISYQISDHDLDVFMNQIISTIKPPGWIFLDGWHLPGLIQSPPVPRSKSFEHFGTKFKREVKVLSVDKLRITKLDIKLTNDDTKQEIISETHLMRAFDNDEIAKLIIKHKGCNIEFYDGSDYRLPLSSNSWRFAVLFKIGE